uniref:Cytohesin 4 n=1 Tax=Equus asinus TaxID=9793 RepID=A0A9L0JI83_EQUAS
MDLCHPDPTELSSGEAEELQRIKWHRKQLLEDIQKLKDEIADVFAQIDCFETAEESRMAQKEKELCIGRKKFNMDPVKGIQYLTEHKLLSPDVQDIAQFLYKGEGLNKTAIGTYLGESICCVPDSGLSPGFTPANEADRAPAPREVRSSGKDPKIRKIC